MPSEQREDSGLTRRDALKMSGLAIGGLTLCGMTTSGCDINSSSASESDTVSPEDTYTYFNELPEYYPGTETLNADEMRISFMGSWYAPRLAQSCNSIFVEVGGGPNGTAADQFIFDCGSGVMGNYNAMGTPLSRMNKIFLTHLHADHMSDLTHIYCFGPAYDRTAPLYVWGPADSGFIYYDAYRNENRGPYEDGTRAFCENLRKALRWHTESFSFQPTSKVNPTIPDQASWGLPQAPVSVGDDDSADAYAMVPIELDWRLEGGVAYENAATGVKITHFPAVHAREGSISYKLEWNGLSMIFTGDTKPNNYVIRQATDGVDVLIHEITTSAEVWAEKFVGLDPASPYWDSAVKQLQNVQDSSHTPQKAFGYILSQLGVPPRLAVGTHFPVSDDTVEPALEDIRKWYPSGDVTIALDFMVLNVSKTEILQRRAVVSEFAWPEVPQTALGTQYEVPKYNDGENADPIAQLDPDRDEITDAPWENK